MPPDSGPIEPYRALLGAGTLKPDAEQARAAQKLDALARALKAYRPSLRIFGLSLTSRKPPKGLYIHGDVGRGNVRDITADDDDWPGRHVPRDPSHAPSEIAKS